MLGSELIAQAIHERGIRRVYTYPGGTLAPLYEALDKLGIEIFVAKSEQGAAFAALAAARLTNTTQVVAVTSGPGVTNVVTPTADAYFDSVPLLVLCGQVGTADTRIDGMRQRGFQETDTISLMRPITKAAISLNQFVYPKLTITEAFTETMTGRYGPVVVDLPMNLQRLDYFDLDVVTYGHPTIKLKDIDIEYVIYKIQRSENPVIIAGHGVILANVVNELRELAHLIQAPVSQSLMGVGVMPSDDPLCLGFHGHTGHTNGSFIHDADLLLVFGSRLDVRQTGTLFSEFAPNADIIHFDVDRTELKNTRITTTKTFKSIQCDLRDFLPKLVTEAKQRLPQGAVQASMDGKDRFYYDYTKDPQNGSKGLSQPYIIKLVDELTRGQNVVVTTGVGLHQSWVARNFTFDWPKRVLLTSGGHGTMGFDLPAAMGAALTRPDDLVICFVGDGSLQMNIQELAIVKEFNLPIKIIVLDNHRLAAVSQFQNLNWGRDLTCGDKYNPDFADIAEAYGITRNDTVDFRAMYRLENVLKYILKCDCPALLHCICDPTEDISPMLLGGQRIDQPWTKE